MVRGKVVLTGVPDNVVVSPTSAGSAFIGANSTTLSSRHVFNLGVLEDCKFMCLFLAKIWWMIPRVGKSASEIPMETQMLLLEAGDESVVGVVDDDSPTELANDNKFYVLVLPVLDGAFRTTLQGTPSNELQFCYESGDPEVQTSQALEGVFVNSGTTLLNSSRIQLNGKTNTNTDHLKKHPGFNRRPLLIWIGLDVHTWDAFYTEVSPNGIKEGLQSFKEGGISPKFLIIDDGWQETTNEYQKEGEPLVEGTQFATRLTDIKENSKFRGSESDGSNHKPQRVDPLHQRELWTQVSLHVYMWHALAGYWGGLLASSEVLKKYNPKLEYPVQSPGNIGNIRDVVFDSLEKFGVGVIDPQKVFDFYNDMHSYLASSGVDGVKVDVQNLLEILGSGHGGRVSITKKQHLSSKKSATARASEDFMPNEPTFQTLHIASVSFNSLLLGEIVVPDWDMFHSNHNTAEFHAAARALGGCPVYVSDKPGKHDFKILQKLVLPDGSVLRARYAGRPTRDCLFVDPVMDGKSLLKIWNLNKLAGVVGVFNCQGAGSWPMKQAAESTKNSSAAATSCSGRVSPLDVEFLDEIAEENWTGDCAVYAFNSGSVSRVPRSKTLEVTLGVLMRNIHRLSGKRRSSGRMQLQRQCCKNEGKRVGTVWSILKCKTNFMQGGQKMRTSLTDKNKKFTQTDAGVPPQILIGLVGYWGGLHPNHEPLKKYKPKIEYPVLSPGSQSHMRCGASAYRNHTVCIRLYNDLHSYLASCGVDGVKVDIQNVVEALGSGYGGRVMLTKKYQEALEESVLKNFNNNLICSMSQNTDFFYSSKKSPVARVSEDYMPHVPAIQTSHVAAVAFNSFFQGEIAAVDWDMFQSDHVTADFHAAARALGGCAVYVTDKPGEHDFKILKKLVLPDGSILRARYAVPHPAENMEHEQVLRRVRVCSIATCQGAGSWNTKIDVGTSNVTLAKICHSQRIHLSLATLVHLISSHLEMLPVKLGPDIVQYMHSTQVKFSDHSLLSKAKHDFHITIFYEYYALQEPFTRYLRKNYGENFRFSPIGLLDMYNSGGAVESLKHTDDSSGCSVTIQARGYGRFGAYSSTKPRACFVDMTEAAFSCSPDDGLLTVTLPGECSLKEIQVLY
ncbi:putative galactinol--sucrose galactosyltransferase 2 [Sesamum angolense]|uniref:Galactinol--sucrose galactosyltransferase 2 n=1 Tax=Sesamum angolense TaxID=2727404 RepID=A0AAE1WZV5_9LAMI|nr:putative galactinol--sucrose galactosyltransferase 2 [Sesamum angolense]